MYAIRRCFKSGRVAPWLHVAVWQQSTGVPLADISASVQAPFIDVALLAVRPVFEAL
jgi:hypothetical protein